MLEPLTPKPASSRRIFPRPCVASGLQHRHREPCGSISREKESNIRFRRRWFPRESASNRDRSSDNTHQHERKVTRTAVPVWRSWWFPGGRRLIRPICGARLTLRGQKAGSSRNQNHTGPAGWERAHRTGPCALETGFKDKRIYE